MKRFNPLFVLLVFIVLSGILGCTNYLCVLHHNSAPSTIHQSKEIVLDSVSSTIQTDFQ